MCRITYTNVFYFSVKTVTRTVLRKIANMAASYSPALRGRPENKQQRYVLFRHRGSESGGDSGGGQKKTPPAGGRTGRKEHFLEN